MRHVPATVLRQPKKRCLPKPDALVVALRRNERNHNLGMEALVIARRKERTDVRVQHGCSGNRMPEKKKGIMVRAHQGSSEHHASE